MGQDEQPQSWLDLTEENEVTMVTKSEGLQDKYKFKTLGN